LRITPADARPESSLNGRPRPVATSFELQQVERLSDAICERPRRAGSVVVLLDLSAPGQSHGLENVRQAACHGRRNLPHSSSSADSTTPRVAVQAVPRRALRIYLIKGRLEGQLLVAGDALCKWSASGLTRQLAEIRRRNCAAKNAQLEGGTSTWHANIQQVFPAESLSRVFPKWAPPSQSALKILSPLHTGPPRSGAIFFWTCSRSRARPPAVFHLRCHGARDCGQALITAIMRGLLEELMPVAADPGKFLGEVNRSLHAILEAGRTRLSWPRLSIWWADCDGNEVAVLPVPGHPKPVPGPPRCPGRWNRSRITNPRHGPAPGPVRETVIIRPVIARSTRRTLLVLFTDGLFEAAESAEGRIWN